MSGSRDFRTLAQGDLGFLEGPVYTPDGTLYVTSISGAGVLKIDPDGTAHVHADTNGGANGATAGPDNELYIAQNGNRRIFNGPRFLPVRTGIQKVTADGTLSWLTEDPITPNDLRFGPDGMLYVTDPTRLMACNDGRLWRVDPRDGAAELLISVPWFPNGLAFGPDDRLYVCDTGNSRIMVTEFDSDGTMAPLEPVVQMTKNNPDGLAFDSNGNLVICGVDLAKETIGTLQTWTIDGEQIDEFTVGRGYFPTNIVFDPNGAETLILTLADLEEVIVVENWGAGGLLPYPQRSA